MSSFDSSKDIHIFDKITGLSMSGSMRKGWHPEVAFIHVHGPACQRGKAGKEWCKDGE